MDKSLILFTSTAVILTMLMGAEFIIQPGNLDAKEIENKNATVSRSIPINSQPPPVMNNNNLTTTQVKVNDNTLIPILMYHAIGDGPNDLFLSTNHFEDQIYYLAINNYNFMTFEDLHNGLIPQKPIIITFDDGYENLYYNAYPILKKYTAKSTIFLISDVIGSNGYLKTKQINEMNNLVSFQSHTATHPDLRTITLGELDYQTRVSKEKIQSLVKNKVVALCYPSGFFNENVIDYTARQYYYGVSIMYGTYFVKDFPYTMSRIRISKGDTVNILEAKLKIN